MPTLADFFPTPLQQFQYMDKYARWIPELKRRETWPETVLRVITFLKKNTKTSFDVSEWAEMEMAMIRLEAMPSMRCVQMAGPALERCNIGAYNCAYKTLDSIDAFAELLYVLMQGTGCSFSVEDRYVSKLMRIKKQRRLGTSKHIIPDTTEGWCDALKEGMTAWFNGRDIEFDFSAIRPAGAALLTKGGRASGPQPLRDLLLFVKSTILARQGKKLTTLDCHDIACFVGSIVQVGGVRRSAELSLSDPEDRDIAECKNGEFWKRHSYRSMSNNSAVYEERPSAIEFMDEWLNLAKSGTGERGIFNRNAPIPTRRKRGDLGCNPCGEINLLDSETCNLSICIARENDSLENLARKVRVATMFGTAQCTLTNFNYVGPKWKMHAEDERLLGVDITGQRDCKLLQADAANVLNHLRHVAVDTNRTLAERFGINQSAAVTCIKPSGNSAALFNCSSGLHARHSQYYIRRVRTGAYTPVAHLMRDAGVPFFPETSQDASNASILVFEFPIKSPDGAICRNDITAAEQFEYWLLNKMHYTEHNPSCTIYVEDHEWLSLGALIYENWDYIGGLSFLPKSNHIYPLAPYEECSKEEYERRVAEFPVLDWSKLPEYEQRDMTEMALDYACTSGSCDI